MTYRKIEVNGKVYEYTVGKTHVKIKGMQAITKDKIGNLIEKPVCCGYYHACYSEYRYPKVMSVMLVKPADIKHYINSLSM